MKKSQDAFLALVRSSLWGSPCVLESKPQWDKIFQIAFQQTLLGIVSDAVSNLPHEMRPCKFETVKMCTKVAGIYQSHSILNHAISNIKGIMDANGISTVLLKGQGVALNYPNPLSRQCGDIDLYVGEENFLAAMNLLEPGVEHDVNKYRHLKHFNTVLEGVSIELHRIAELLPGIAADRRFQEWTLQQLHHTKARKVDIGGCMVNLPSVQFDAVYIMYHAWHHFINGGIGLRQLCDWCLHLHRYHNEIDSAQLERDLARFGLNRAWNIMSAVAVAKLGLPANECPLYTNKYDSLAEKVLQIIFEEGNFGRFSSLRLKQRPKGYLGGKFYTFKIVMQRTFALLPIAPADMIRFRIMYILNGLRDLAVRM